jgi:hypothetical protein
MVNNRDEPILSRDLEDCGGLFRPSGLSNFHTVKVVISCSFAPRFDTARPHIEGFAAFCAAGK